MASITISRSALLVVLLLQLSMTWQTAGAAAAHYKSNRISVPVHHGGDPVGAEDRRGPYQRQGYDTYSSYYQETPAEDSSILAYVLPALAVTGLSLLFPNIVTVNTGRRRRRSDAGSEAPINELSEHMMNIYYAAMESDECMQRIACEIGAASKSLKSENLTSMVSVISASAPTKYTKLFEKFKTGMNAEKCEKLGCSLLDQ